MKNSPPPKKNIPLGTIGAKELRGITCILKSSDSYLLLQVEDESDSKWYQVQTRFATSCKTEPKIRYFKTWYTLNFYQAEKIFEYVTLYQSR